LAAVFLGGGRKLSVSCKITGQAETCRTAVRPTSCAIDDRMLGQMIACATTAVSPLKVAVGDP
jgi:hypothetical protein